MLTYGAPPYTYQTYLHDQGPAVGPGSSSVATVSQRKLLISGWVTFSGADIAAKRDRRGDARLEDRDAGPAGTDITGARITYRPEGQDLLLRLGLSSMPGPVVAGASEILYRWTLRVGKATYEVRAARTDGGQTPQGPPSYLWSVGPYVHSASSYGLYRCRSSSCERVARLAGGIGTVGDDVWVSVPLGALHAAEGDFLTHIGASTALGGATVGAIRVIDAVEVGRARIPVTDVRVGIGSGDRARFTVPAATAIGRYAGTINVRALRPGAYRLWVRACVGRVCGAGRLGVKLG